MDGNGLRLYLDVGGVTVAGFRLDAVEGLVDSEPTFPGPSSLDEGGRGKA